MIVSWQKGMGRKILSKITALKKEGKKTGELKLRYWNKILHNMQSKKAFYILLLLFNLTSLHAFSPQTYGIISGPWAGNVELRNATIWVEVSPKVKSVAVRFNPDNKIADVETVTYKG